MCWKGLVYWKNFLHVCTMWPIKLPHWLFMCIYWHMCGIKEWTLTMKMQEVVTLHLLYNYMYRTFHVITSLCVIWFSPYVFLNFIQEALLYNTSSKNTLHDEINQIGEIVTVYCTFIIFILKNWDNNTYKEYRKMHCCTSWVIAVSRSNI